MKLTVLARLAAPLWRARAVVVVRVGGDVEARPAVLAVLPRSALVL